MLKIFKSLWDLFGAVMFILLVALAVQVSNRKIETPTVYQSIKTGECVSVSSPNNSFSCNSLPDQYETVRIGTAEDFRHGER